MKMTAFMAVVLFGVADGQVAKNSSGSIDYLPVCGDCWCVPEAGVVNGECPAFGQGLCQTVPVEWAAQYRSMKLIEEGSDIFVFTAGETEGSPECFPFADAIGPGESYPESQYPQCQFQAGYNNSEAVCAFSYVNGQSCQGREYRMNSFENAAAAEEAGAVVTHSGPCGACSSAADLAVRFETMGGTLTEHAAICGVLHSVDPTSTIVDLTACFLKLGFTQECALLWAVSANSVSIDNSCQTANA
jgi:hypothetical protein